MLREGVVLIAGGFVLGAIGAVALRKSLESQLFGVSATDPVVILAVTRSFSRSWRSPRARSPRAARRRSIRSSRSAE